MTEIEVGGYRVLCDVEMTRTCYEESPQEAFTSLVAENYWAVQAELLSGGFGEVLASLGIDPTKPAEYYIPIDDLLSEDPKRPGNVIYSGWFHFIGEIVVYRAAYAEREMDARLAGDESISHFKDFLREGLSVRLHEGNTFAHEPFKGHRLIQLEFCASLPCIADGLI